MDPKSHRLVLCVTMGSASFRHNLDKRPLVGERGEPRGGSDPLSRGWAQLHPPYLVAEAWLLFPLVWTLGHLCRSCLPGPTASQGPAVPGAQQRVEVCLLFRKGLKTPSGALREETESRQRAGRASRPRAERGQRWCQRRRPDRASVADTVTPSWGWSPAGRYAGAPPGPRTSAHRWCLLPVSSVVLCVGGHGQIGSGPPDDLILRPSPPYGPCFQLQVRPEVLVARAPTLGIGGTRLGCLTWEACWGGWPPDRSSSPGPVVFRAEQSEAQRGQGLGLCVPALKVGALAHQAKLPAAQTPRLRDPGRPPALRPEPP